VHVFGKSSSANCLGVLVFKPRGYQGLVFDFNTMLIWDGDKYVEQ
jgi:hypothetical protein